MTVNQTLISQNKTGNIRLIKEEYTTVQKRYIVENKNYFNSFKNFHNALDEYNELNTLEQKTKFKNEVKKHD